MNSALIAQADLFRSLHDPAAPLALVNAWDVMSACVAQEAGARAIATTSAGVAWSHGVRDGDHLKRDYVLDLVARISAAVDLPVTADLERGYAESAADVAATVDGLLGAGAVGLNIEDGTHDPAELVARIAVARAAADRAGVPLFINARTDMFLRGLGAPAERLAATISRAAQYVDAGADGIFVPGVVDPETVAALTSAISVPVNILAGPGAPAVGDLGRLGVARVSLGSTPVRAAYAVVRRAVHELQATGRYDAVDGAIDYAEIDGLLDPS